MPQTQRKNARNTKTQTQNTANGSGSYHQCPIAGTSAQQQMQIFVGGGGR